MYIKERKFLCLLNFSTIKKELPNSNSLEKGKKENE